MGTADITTTAPQKLGDVTNEPLHTISIRPDARFRDLQLQGVTLQ